MVNGRLGGSKTGSRSVFRVVVFIHILLLLIVFAFNGFFMPQSEEVNPSEEQKNEEKPTEVAVTRTEKEDKEKTEETKVHTFVHSLSTQGPQVVEVKIEETLDYEPLAREAIVPRAETQSRQVEEKSVPVKPDVSVDKNVVLVDEEDNDVLDKTKDVSNDTDELEVVQDSEPIRYSEQENDSQEQNPIEFDNDEYEEELLSQYGVEDGEKMPVLLIDNDKQTYKEGLAFYGFDVLIARPLTPFVDDKFYYVITDYSIDMVKQEFPFNGVFQQALPEDDRKFMSLLAMSGSKSNDYDGEYQIFYSPSLETGAHMTLLSKQKMILCRNGITSEEVASMTGSFTKVGKSYIIIIKSIKTYDGRDITVIDPDDRSLLVRS
jgi:hypothetical protein